jgi:hypothetical protein
MYDSTPYHFAFLDFAFNDNVSLEYLETFDTSVQWNALEAGWTNINEGNVMVIAAVFNEQWHQGYSDPPKNTHPFDAYYVDAVAAAVPGEIGFNEVVEGFSHTVFCEEGTAVSCHYCPSMGHMLFDIYESHEYPFYFIALVEDRNPLARERLDELNCGSIPVGFFDGGCQVLLGGNTPEPAYHESIQACGTQDVHQLNLSISVEWLGEGNLKIDVHILNKESNEVPVLQIGEISGGFGGVTTSVRNIGGASASNVTWSVSVDGGLFHLIQLRDSGKIAMFGVDQQQSIGTSKFIVGFGRISVNVSVAALNVNVTYREARFWIVGPLIFKGLLQ